MTESSQNAHDAWCSEEPKVVTSNVSDEKGHLDSQSPEFRVICGGKDQVTGTWQEKLKQKCYEAQTSLPIYETFSDKRGGRTAWSSKVTVFGKCIPARYWYDGKYLHNAREDAAERVLKSLTI